MSSIKISFHGNLFEVLIQMAGSHPTPENSPIVKAIIERFAELDEAASDNCTFSQLAKSRIEGSWSDETAIEAAKKQLAQVEAEVELLEQTSALKKRVRKYKIIEPAETWASRWVAAPIAYLFPQERREEWLGDLYEVNREMFCKGYPHWLININNFCRTFILVLSAFQIKVSDLLTIATRKSE